MNFVFSMHFFLSNRTYFHVTPQMALSFSWPFPYFFSLPLISPPPYFILPFLSPPASSIAIYSISHFPQSCTSEECQCQNSHNRESCPIFVPRDCGWTTWPLSPSVQHKGFPYPANSALVLFLPLYSLLTHPFDDIHQCSNSIFMNANLCCSLIKFGSRRHLLPWGENVESFYPIST